MIITQQYQGGDLIITQRELSLLGITVGDVVEIGKIPHESITQKQQRRERLQQFLLQWQTEWANVDWDDYEQTREEMWQTWTSLNWS